MEESGSSGKSGKLSLRVVRHLALAMFLKDEEAVG